MISKPCPLFAAISIAVSMPVFAEGSDTQRVFTLDKVTVAATLNEERMADVANTVTVLDAEAISQAGANDIRQALRYETGVEVESGGRFGLSGFNIRGMNENRVKIVVDGLDQSKSFIPGGDFQRVTRNTVDIDSIKQLEVVKGPASAVYGSDAIGGVVAFTTKDPADYLSDGDDTHVGIKTAYASVDESLNTSLTLAGRSGQLESLLLYTHRDGSEHENQGRVGGSGSSRTQPNPEDSRSDNLLAKFQYQVNQAHRIELQLEYFKQQFESDLLTRNNYNDYSAYFGPGNFLSYDNARADDESERKRVSLAHKWQANLSVFDQLSWSLDWQQTDSRQQTLEDLDASPLVQTIFRIQPGNRIKDYSHEQENTQLQAQFSKAFTEHQITYGFKYEDTQIDNVTNTLYPQAPDLNTGGSYIPSVDGSNWGVYLQDKVSLLDGRLILTPSLRYDSFDAEPEGGAASSHDSSKASFRLGSVFKLNDGVSVFAQFAQGFKAPDVYQLYYDRDGGTYKQEANPNLKAEESNSFEVGLRFNGKLGAAEVTAFYNEYDDFISNQLINVDAPYTQGLSRFVNISEAEIKGLELRASLYLDEAMSAPLGTSAQLSIAYADGKGRDAVGDQWAPLDTVSPMKAVMGLNYDEPNGSWGSSINWTLSEAKDASDASEADAALSSGYGLVDVSAYYQFSDDLLVRANIYNLGDKTYSRWDDIRGLSNSSTVLDRFTQAGRHFNVSVQYSF